MSLLHDGESRASMQKLCKAILLFDDVRFAGVISNYGNLYAGGFKEGVMPYESNEKRRLMYMRFALESCFRNDFNDSLGDFEYSIIQRAKVSIITKNICNYLLLVFAEPYVEIHALVNKIETIINSNQASH